MFKRSLIVLALLLMFVTPSYAGNSSKNDKKLIKMGYTQEQLNMLSNEFKDYIAENETGELVAVKVSRMKESDISKVGDISTSGWISPGDLNFVLSIFKQSYIDGKQYYRFYADYNWYSNPYWKLVDQIGIAWSDDWNIKAYSEYLVYYRTGEVTNKTFMDEYKKALYTPAAGAHFNNLDLKELSPLGDEHCTDHRGWMRIDAYKAVSGTGSTDYTDVLAKYYHQYATPSGNITISKSPSIDITYSTNYDYTQDFGSFSYKK